MTVLTLNLLWINRVDTGEAIAATSSPDSRDQSFSDAVSVRQYASGRRRAIGVEGEEGNLSFKLIKIDAATKDKLRTWKGVTVQVRDWRGQKWFGAFATVDVGEYEAYPNLYTARIALSTVSYTEGV